MDLAVGIISGLSEDNYFRRVETGNAVIRLWKPMLHPPLSYLGDKFQYRQPDGSYNVGWRYGRNEHRITYMNSLNRVFFIQILAKVAHHMQEQFHQSPKI